jgi:hypothetical protein
LFENLEWRKGSRIDISSTKQKVNLLALAAAPKALEM